MNVPASVAGKVGKQWGGCPITSFCTRSSLAELEVLHVKRVIEAGLDANAVPFPRPLQYESKRRLQFLLHDGAMAQNPDDMPFVLPGSKPSGVEGMSEKKAMSESEKEVYELWLSGLARSAEDLRVEIRSDPTLFDTEVVAWPMVEENVIAEDRCTNAQL